MKLTKTKLRQIIKEEMQHILKEQEPYASASGTHAAFNDWTWLESRLNRIDRQLTTIIAATAPASKPPPAGSTRMIEP